MEEKRKFESEKTEQNREIESYRLLIKNKENELHQLKQQESQNQQLVMNLNNDLNYYKEELKTIQERKDKHEEEVQRQK